MQVPRINRRITCECCGKQALNAHIGPNNSFTTTLIGAVAGFKSSSCICGHCAKDLDENGLFPEEQAQAIV